MPLRTHYSLVISQSGTVEGRGRLINSQSRSIHYQEINVIRYVNTSEYMDGVSLENIRTESPYDFYKNVGRTSRERIQKSTIYVD